VAAVREVCLAQGAPKGARRMPEKVAAPVV
jgi:hypothetical protein